MKLPKIDGLNTKRTAIILVILFVVAGSIVGCMNRPQAPALGSAAGGAAYEKLSSSPTVATFMATTYSANVPSGAYTSSFGGRMVELQAQLTVQVDDPKSTSSEITTLTSSLGGYVAESSFYDSWSTSDIVLRVPQANFTLALKQLAALGKVESQSISGDDITEQYVNMQAQLSAYKAEELTLLRILNNSNTVTDALATENAIRDVRAQIDQIEGTLRVMDRLVNFATVNIQLTQPAENPTLDFKIVVQSAILGFYTVVSGMLILGASILPIASVGGVAYYSYHRYSRNKSKTIGAKVNAEH
jgi:hypothetical protein